MKKMTKRGIFLLMTVIVLFQSISPIAAIANTTEKTDLIGLKTAKVVDQDDKTVTVNLKVTANNATAAQKSDIKLDNHAAVVKEVLNKTTTSQNKYTLSNNVITATIAAAVNQEDNDIQIKLDKASLKGINTLQLLSGNSKKDIDVSDVKQESTKNDKTPEYTTPSTVTSSRDKDTIKKEATTGTDTKTKKQLRDATPQGGQDIAKYLPDSCKGSIFDKINLVYKDSKGNTVAPDNFPADGTIDFNYTWSIPNELKDGYQLKDGDSFTFKLPDNISYRPGTGTLGDYGDYVINADGTVKFTFKDLSGMENISGTFGYNQSTITTNVPGETTIDVPTKDGSNTEKIIVKPTGGNDIAKAGRFDKVNNPNQIFWDVTVNTNGSHLQNASVTDAFPDGNTFKSATVYPLTIDKKGKVTGQGPALIAGTDYDVDANGKVIFKGQYADTYKAFKISYITTIDDEKNYQMVVL